MRRVRFVERLESRIIKSERKALKSDWRIKRLAVEACGAYSWLARRSRLAPTVEEKMKFV